MIIILIIKIKVNSATYWSLGIRLKLKGNKIFNKASEITLTIISHILIRILLLDLISRNGI